MQNGMMQIARRLEVYAILMSPARLIIQLS